MNTIKPIKEISNKNILRKNAIEKRDFMAKIGVIEKISKTITNKIKNSKDYKNAEHIALYYPIKSEINLLKTINTEKNFYLPVCRKNKMYFAKYESNDKLKIGCFKIPEPVSEIINPEILDVIYLPALMANKNNYRLGYGKGFYDRFFNENKINAKKIIVTAKIFCTDEFLEDKYDYQCDKVLTEDTLY